MFVIVFVEAHLVWVDDGVVVFDGDFLGWASVALGLSLGNIGGDHFVFEAVFEGGGAGDAGAELQDDAVVTLELVSVAGNVWAWADEGHCADEDVPEFGEFVDLVVTEFGAQGGDA